MNRALKEFDFSVVCGFRNEHDQNEAYDAGRSKLKFPHSKHNEFPSMAVDCCPYPVNWSDSVKFTEMATVILRIAKELMIPLIWGGSWRFVDMAHFELPSDFQEGGR